MHTLLQTNQTHQIYFLLMTLSCPIPTAFQLNLEVIKTNYLWFFFKCILLSRGLISFNLLTWISVSHLWSLWDPIPSYPPLLFVCLFIFGFFFFWYFLSTQLLFMSTFLPYLELLEGWCSLYCFCICSVFHKTRTQTCGYTFESVFQSQFKAHISTK